MNAANKWWFNSSLSHFSQIFFLILATMIWSQISSATTYYASPSIGSDSNNGTSTSTPFRHISYGYTMMSAGDTLILMDGTFDNEGQIGDYPTTPCCNTVVPIYKLGTASAWYTIKAQHRGMAILDCGTVSDTQKGCDSYFFVHAGAGYWIFQDLVLQHSNHAMLQIEGGTAISHMQILGNIFQNDGNITVGEPGTGNASGNSAVGWADGATDWTIDGNVFTNLGATSCPGCTNHFDHGIYAHGGPNIMITNNIFYNQTAGYPIQMADGANGWTIANNTFVNNLNVDDSGAIMMWNNNTNITIENNIFYQPTSIPVAISSYCDAGSGNCSHAGSVVDHNLIYGSIASMTGGSSNLQDLPVSNTFVENPMLVNILTAPYDFHLQSGSPAIGAGLNLSSLFSDDFSGSLRSSWDLGAYAYTNASTSGQPAVTLSNPSWSFGNLVVGSSSAVKYITLTNSGTAPLTLPATLTMNPTPGDIAFAGLGNCGTVVNAGASCTISIIFSPTSAGTKSATIVLYDNAPGAPHIIPLSGTGVSPNLVLNSGFENGLTSWINWGNSSVVSSPVHSGSHALRVGAGAGGVGQNITGLAPNGTYSFSAYAYMNRPTAQYASLQVAFQDASGNDIAGYVYVAHITSTSYALYNLSVTAPSTFSSVQVRVWNNAGRSYVYVDDFNLY